MKLKSLCLKTDIIFIKFDGEVIDRDTYQVVKCHSNPNFFWGNFLIFKNAPKKCDLGKWKSIFAHEFADPQIYHQTFAWDEEEIGEIKPFQEDGFKLEKSVVLVANKNQLKLPIKNHPEIDVLPLKREEDWKDVVKMQEGISPQYGMFYQKQAITYQRMIKKNIGLWFGAYLGDKLIGSLGIFTEGNIGCFQIVSTHLDFQRQGVCGTLVYKASDYAFSKMGVETLVMVADESYHAAKIYESVGFVPQEKMYGLCRSQKNN